MVVALVFEIRTSTLQAEYLSAKAAELTYTIGEGPSPKIRFPGPGPYDIRLGYHSLPSDIERLASAGYRVTAQAKVSAALADLIDGGVFAIYREKSRAGLALTDRRGKPIYRARTPERAFKSFQEIPEPVISTLLFIESREFLDERHPKRNPAVEWDRLASAVADLALRMLGYERDVPGASTIATQLEKFRHSPDGITRSPRDKLIQMAAASLRAYLDGPDTVQARRRVVLDYLNSVPMAAIAGHGEVIGLGDGLWAWYGTELAHVSAALTEASEPTAVISKDMALAYRQVLSLLLGHRRPSYYLATAAGRADLAYRTDRYLNLLSAHSVVKPSLAAAARRELAMPRSRAPERPAPSFVDRKGENQVRNELLGLLDSEDLYELDRKDLTVRTTIDKTLQDAVTALFGWLRNAEFVRETGLAQPRLLGKGDVSRVVYAFTLFERTRYGNLLRATTDNLDAPFSFNESARIELGSTAKLRTLVSYLEVVASLHQELTSGRQTGVASQPVGRFDRLTAWARSYLRSRPEASLAEMLDAAMARRYSANPHARFVTGGGMQSFSNFDDVFDDRTVTVAEGFRHSVNLVFVRLMRDLVNYHMYRLPGSTARVLEEGHNAERATVLAQFADREGSEFVRRFYRRYQNLTEPEILDRLFDGRRRSARRMAWAYRAVRPDATLDQFSDILATQLPETTLRAATFGDLYRSTSPGPHPLSDLGYLASVHPLELWVARWLLDHPGGSLENALAESADARQEVYGWLFRTHRRNAQDRRIRYMLEIEAFAEIQASWSRLGYPFPNLVPSLGTAIGSSGDRPSALAELIGILLNDGLKLPSVLGNSQKKRAIEDVDEVVFSGLGRRGARTPV